MPTFPTLNSNSVAQYPLEVRTSYLTQSVRFLDGSRQNYQLFGRPLRRWRIDLDLLDDHELSNLSAFVEQQQGGTFVFPDPVSGTSVGNCVLSVDGFVITARDELRGKALVFVEEVA